MPHQPHQPHLSEGGPARPDGPAVAKANFDVLLGAFEHDARKVIADLGAPDGGPTAAGVLDWAAGWWSSLDPVSIETIWPPTRPADGPAVALAAVARDLANAAQLLDEADRLRDEAVELTGDARSAALDDADRARRGARRIIGAALDIARQAAGGAR